MLARRTDPSPSLLLTFVDRRAAYAACQKMADDIQALHRQGLEQVYRSFTEVRPSREVSALMSMSRLHDLHVCACREMARARIRWRS